MKRYFRKIHLWLSLAAGILLAILCLTGAILVFQPEIQKALDPGFFQIKDYEGREALPIDTLMQIADQTVRAEGKTLESAQFYSQPDKPCMFKVVEVKGLYLSINPYTGEVVGQGAPAGSFFFKIRCLHRWLLCTPDGWIDRQLGKKIMGLASIFMTLILLSGVIIVIPKSKMQWKQLFAIRKGKQRFLWWFTSHRALGLYSVIFLLLMTLTGPIWSFSWYRTGLSKVLGIYDGKDAMGKTGGGHQKATQPDVHVWAEACKQVMAEVPEYRLITVQNNRINVATNKHKHPRASDSFRVDEYGNISDRAKYEDLPGNRKFMGYAAILHTGTWGGPIVKVFYFLSCLVGCYLVVSGIILFVKKQQNKLRVLRKQP